MRFKGLHQKMYQSYKYLNIRIQTTIQKLAGFLYANNENINKEVKKTILFTRV